MWCTVCPQWCTLYTVLYGVHSGVQCTVFGPGLFLEDCSNEKIRRVFSSTSASILYNPLSSYHTCSLPLFLFTSTISYLCSNHFLYFLIYTVFPCQYISLCPPYSYFPFCISIPSLYLLSVPVSPFPPYISIPSLYLYSLHIIYLLS